MWLCVSEVTGAAIKPQQKDGGQTTIYKDGLTITKDFKKISDCTFIAWK